jgi:hypothetical protein
MQEHASSDPCLPFSILIFWFVKPKIFITERTRTDAVLPVHYNHSGCTSTLGGFITSNITNKVAADHFIQSPNLTFRHCHFPLKI